MGYDENRQGFIKLMAIHQDSPRERREHQQYEDKSFKENGSLDVADTTDSADAADAADVADTTDSADAADTVDSVDAVDSLNSVDSVDPIETLDLFEVTRVESQLKHPGKYDIYLNGQFAYTVHEDTLIVLKLLKGTKLDRADLARLEREERINEAWNKAIRWIGRRPYASQEIERKLLQAGWEEETASAVIEKLKQQQLIDDRSFAEQWTDNRIRVQKKGRHLIRHELMQKGVAKADIEAAVNSVDPTAELDSALQLGQKKWRQTTGDFRNRRQKTSAYLMRRGFPSDIVREVIRQCSDEGVNEEDEDWLY